MSEETKIITSTRQKFLFYSLLLLLNINWLRCFAETTCVRKMSESSSLIPYNYWYVWAFLSAIIVWFSLWPNQCIIIFAERKSRLIEEAPDTGYLSYRQPEPNAGAGSPPYTFTAQFGFADREMGRARVCWIPPENSSRMEFMRSCNSHIPRSNVAKCQPNHTTSWAQERPHTKYIFALFWVMF